MPRLDYDPESWRRCSTCYGKLVRLTSERQFSKHVGHRLTPAVGFHINEYLRILLGLL